MSWTVHPISCFDQYADAWDRINASASDIPFLRSLFIRKLLQSFGTGDERLAVLGAAGEEQVLCILANRRAGVWETFQPSQLPLGAWVMRPELTYARALDGLVQRLPGIPLLIAVTQQDPIVHSRPVDGGALRTLDYIETGWIDVDRSYDDYWSGRSKSLRQNMRTQRSKLAAQGVNAALEIVSDPQGVAEAIADYARLESAGWKASAGTAIGADNEQGAFYRSVLEDFCRAGAGRIYRYRFNDRVVAVDLCIESQTVQVLLKTTYDETIKGLSPAALMRQESYRSIFDARRIKRIEFYGRVMEWTTRWTENKRTLFHVNMYRWSILPVIRQRMRRNALRRRTDTAPS